MQVLRERLYGKSRAGERRDGWHLALAIEGGGMSGVVSGGMVSAIHELGMTRIFDSVHGSSSGAAAGAYLVAGCPRAGMSIYFEDINNVRFIDFWRPLRGGPIMDVEFLAQHVFRKVKPLPAAELLKPPVQLRVVTTDADAGTPFIIDAFEGTDDVFAALQSSMTYPYIGGAPVEFRGRRLLDGVLCQPAPIRSAAEVGATHVVLLVNAATTSMVSRAAQCIISGLKGMQVNEAEVPFFPYPEILRVEPTGAPLSPFTCDGGLLRDGANRGYAAIRELLREAQSNRHAMA